MKVWVIDKFCLIHLFSSLVQGISHWTGHYELGLKDRNMQVKSCLKVVWEFWDYKFLINILGFQKSNIGWPQQPPTESKYFFYHIDSTLKQQLCLKDQLVEFVAEIKTKSLSVRPQRLLGASKTYAAPSQGNTVIILTSIFNI